MEVGLLRLTQEALLNVDKHARASRADVRIERADGWISLEVCDDGVGFELLERVGNGTGIGSMRERTELLGGTLDLVSRPGGGTAISVRFPANGTPA